MYIMSLNLEESCKKYVSYCRRNKDCPTFEEFNANHYTNLPHDPDTYSYFYKQLAIAKKNTGLPVTRRLPSLMKRFKNHMDIPNQAIPSPSVQIRPALKALCKMPTDSTPMSMSIRAPLVLPKSALVSFEDYKKRIFESKSILLKVKGGLLVHLVPATFSSDFEKKACKLTKKTWDTLRGKSEAPLKMRDGSMLNMSTIQLDQSDLALFINDRKNKKDGPYFIRYVDN
jgi:hypothetical protein